MRASTTCSGASSTREKSFATRAWQDACACVGVGLATAGSARALGVQTIVARAKSAVRQEEYFMGLLPRVGVVVQDLQCRGQRRPRLSGTPGAFGPCRR